MKKWDFGNVVLAYNYYSRWTDFMDFFSAEVQELGIDGAVDKYLFKPELFGRFFSGVNHGLIHLGYPA
jgi:hypothetical protein